MRKNIKKIILDSKVNISIGILIIITILVFAVGIYRENKIEKANRIMAKEYNAKQSSQIQKSETTNKYKDKVWYAIGDSFTAQNLYPYYLNQMMQFSSYVNDGISGQEIGTMANRVTSEKLSKVNLVTVFGGTNDYALGKSLGTINDNENVDTFYGNIQKVIDKIRTANPKVEIVFMTPTKRGNFTGGKQPIYPALNDKGFKLEQYVQAIKDVCSKNSIKIIDLFNLSGIDTSNLSTYTKDNLHPNEAGAKKIDEVIQQELEK